MINSIKVADLELNSTTAEVKRADTRISLTSKELKLLEYLMMNKGKTLTREMILETVWHYSPDIETRVVDVYIGYLKKKIENDNSKKLIYSIRGSGYMIKD